MSRRKIKNQIKKSVKSNPVKVLLTGLIILVLVFVALGYLYINGYLDEYLKNVNGDDYNPPTYNSVFEQNEEGYYYYTDLGFEDNGYYVSIEGLEGDLLISELNRVLNNNFNKVSYGDARYILAHSDRNIEDDGNTVRGMYDNDEISTTWIGVGEGRWQREHVWPNSKLGIESVNISSRNQGSDLHNLRAITGINQSRSNRYFTEGEGIAKTVGTEAFYPGDDHRGDVARIMFYMAIMYDVLTLTNDIPLLVNDPLTNYTPEGAYGGLLDQLIEWHRLDPVDEFEQQRNNYIYGEITLSPDGKEISPQGNRNPFIDKPELVHIIWEDMTIEELVKEESEATSFSSVITYKTVNNTFLSFYESRRIFN